MAPKVLKRKVYTLIETDVFFEKDLKVIEKHYMSQQEVNSQSVAELIYNFFFFYVYEFDTANMIIDIKEGGFTQKKIKDKYPFSIQDPFETL